MIEIQFYLANDWCCASRKMHNVFWDLYKEMTSEGIKMTYIDVESDWGVDMSCKYKVRNVPTILVVKDCKVLESRKGRKTKSEIKDIVEKWK